MEILLTILKPIWRPLAAIGGILLAVLTIFLNGRSAGIKKVEDERKDELLDTYKEIRDAEKDLADKPTESAADRLRDKWCRD
jgi:hypothetical protein